MEFHFPSAVAELSGQGVLLRELCERDIPAWFARATDAESADLAGDPIPDSIEAGAGWLQRHRTRFVEQQAIRWAIVPEGLGDSVGTVGLVIASRDPATAALGIVVNRSHWGKGIGTAAARLACDYAFASLGLLEIRAEVLQRNTRSLRLLQKAGFGLERVVGAAESSDGEPCFHYSLRRGGR